MRNNDSDEKKTGKSRLLAETQNDDVSTDAHQSGSLEKAHPTDAFMGADDSSTSSTETMPENTSKSGQQVEDGLQKKENLGQNSGSECSPGSGKRTPNKEMDAEIGSNTKSSIEDTMSELSSLMRGQIKSHSATPQTDPAESLATIQNQSSLNDVTLAFLNTIRVLPADYIGLSRHIIQRVTEEFARSEIHSEINTWNKLYENFRIGLQLGFRNFFDALKRSDEEIPEQDEPGSAWSWSTWERVARDLLNNFDNYCRKEILLIIEDPGTFIEKESLHETLEQLSNEGESGDALISKAQEAINVKILEKMKGLKSKLDMSGNLKKLANNPSIISNDFETYLWANYITERKIGSYDNSLRGRLHISPRIAPKGQVTARLKHLQVAEADQLDAITGKRANNDSLKALHDWARTKDREFDVWTKISDNTKKFSMRSRARMFTNSTD